MPQSRRAAFTLVEMAIVIAMIGLVAGAIVAGRSLLRGSQITKVLTEVGQFRTALDQFRDQYGYYPGDFPTATQVWGRADGNTAITANCTAPTTTASPDGVATCNGNGNGLLDEGSGEQFWAWQQMAAAGFISGKYTGVYITGAPQPWAAIPGVNVPKGPLDDSGYYLYTWGHQTTDWYYYAGDYDNTFTFGKHTPDSWPDSPILYGREAYAMDVKEDDGLPGLGSIRAMRGGPLDIVAQNCATTNVAATAVYVRNSTVSCAMGFMNTFRAPSSAR